MRLIYIILIVTLILFMGNKPLSAAVDPTYIDTHVHLKGISMGKSSMGSGQQSGQQSRQLSRLQGGRGPAQQGGQNETQGLAGAANNLFYRMSQYQVAQSLLVVVPGFSGDAEKEFQNLKRITEDYPGRLKLMAGGALLAPYLQTINPYDVTDIDKEDFRIIAESILDEGAVGFGEMISYHLCMAPNHSFQFAPADHPLFLLLVDIAADNNVPIDLHMEAITHTRPTPANLLSACEKNPTTLQPTISALETMLSHNPGARIVWQHIGWDNAGGDMTPRLMRRLLSQYENLYLGIRIEKRTYEVGNGGMMPNRIINRNGTINEHWRQLIMDFPERFVIGSDEFFFTSLEERGNQSFQETWQILDQLPGSIAQMIGYENPSYVYGLQN